jgi:hypothetical protein
VRAGGRAEGAGAQAGAVGVIMVDNQGKTDGWMVARCIPKGTAA